MQTHRLFTQVRVHSWLELGCRPCIQRLTRPLACWRVGWSLFLCSLDHSTCAAYIDAFPPLTCPLSFAVVLVGLPSPENRNMEVFDLISRNLNEVRGAIIGGMGAGGCLRGGWRAVAVS